MPRIDVEKKRATRWPWLLGLGLLALVFWGVTVLSRAPVEEEPVPAGITTPDTLPPALIPSNPATAAPQATQQPPRVGSLDEGDIGRVTRVEGEVVATGDDVFWVLSGSHVLRVDSDRRARRGDSIAVEGTVRSTDGAMTDRMASEVMSRNADFESWTLIRSLKLVEERDFADGGETGG